jgi:hypothetical protein
VTINPYESPTAHTEPKKVQSRLWRYLDIAGIIAAATPFIWLAALMVLTFVMAMVLPPEQWMSNETLDMLLLSAAIPWLIGALYNLVAINRGRKLPVIGLVINIASLGLFLLLFIWGSAE